MKRAFVILACLLLSAGMGLRAQEVTITLKPGWTWIGFPYVEAKGISEALPGFTPMEGDQIKSQADYSTYEDGEWGGMGELEEVIPGLGYMYYSGRTEAVQVVLNASSSSNVTVTTIDPTDITASSMVCGGEVTDAGNSAIVVRGVCWSTQQNPTVADAHTTDSYGTGGFSSIVEGLLMNTTYYVRAYAMTTNGVVYGGQKAFSTLDGIPVLTTLAVSDIGSTWATCGGEVTDDGGLEVTERGICWGASLNPTINGEHVSSGSGLGSFTANMSGLTPNTTYYVRAYATNARTTAYGNEVSFLTESVQTWPNGKLPGQFSVSETRQVHFSQGNLQYQASTDTWRFASDQWECIGEGNANISATYDGYIDLIGWGTSGWDNGNIYYHPYDYEYLTDWNAYDYAYGYGPTDGTNYNFNLTGDYANADWGVYNAIQNGGNQTRQWRTLTMEEWSYIFNDRTTASGIRYAKAQVSGVNGVVVVPDDWDGSVYTLNYTNRTDAPYSTNVISEADWVAMENNGVVFLPAAGYRNGPSFDGFGSYGYYWSSSISGSDYASDVFFTESGFSPNYGSYRYEGQSVRLVSMSLPEVTTGAVDDVSGRSAFAGGNITSNGDVDMVTCGVCCSTSSTPTTDDIVALAQNNGMGEFTVTLRGLEPSTTYSARAFVTTSAGTVYGDEVSFTTMDVPTWTNGILPGQFSVSDGRYVQFSQGNLQYIGSATTPYWHFADYQYDYFGTTTGQDSGDQNVDRDLFCWGTSGYNHGANCYQPWSTSETGSDYYAYGDYQYNLYSQTGQADWGYNPISNGGNQENQWRTLSIDEWRYILSNRTTTSGIHYAKAQVFGVNGVILLPDDWDVSYYTLSSTDSSDADFSNNVITASDWSILELHGAVFLPAAGSRFGPSVYDVGSYGGYWSSSCSNSWSVYGVSFGSYISTNGITRYGGQSVRLVHVAENPNQSFTVSVLANPAEGGTVTGNGIYEQGQDCTVSAAAQNWYFFANWTENGEVVSTEAIYSFTVDGNRNLIANFEVPSIGGHAYVDLGLPSGTLWAICNVGADSPERYGDYFAWGETQPKSTYNWSTYQYCNGSNNTLTKYSNNSNYGNEGYTDDLTTLLPEDDAATANWGGEWRMPTKEEWEELYNNTTITWTTHNGKRGCLFTGSNGNSLFLPTAGYRNGSSLNETSTNGYYWSSTLYTNSNKAWEFIFYAGSYNVENDYRYYGQSVRAVHSGQK